MGKKFLISLSSLIVITVAAILSAFICACAEDKFPIWNIGNNVTAKFSDDGNYGFILTVEGEGEIPEYSTAKNAPWYGKSGRIKQIIISDGITSIGSNAFAECVATGSVILPESVTEIGTNVFSEKTMIFAYSQVNSADGAKIYLYSESAPSTDGEYWRYKNGVPAVWDTTKVLFIGNSFTYYSDIPELFANIARSVGESVIVESVTCGSHTLTQFADATDEYGKTVDEKLNSSDNYDVVVLQEQSTTPLNNYSAFLAAAKSLQAKIKATQTDCKIYLYSTWGYKDGADARNMTVPEMEAAIRTAYENAAREMNVKISCVGAAFTAVYTAYPDINLYYYADNKHPSYPGAYLSACVHAAAILNIDPRTTDFIGAPTDSKDESLDSATAEILRGAAHSAVFGN